MTNALRAQIVVAANALLGVVTNFGIDLSTRQVGSICVAVNAVLGVWIAATYKSSPRRTPDAPDGAPAAD